MMRSLCPATHVVFVAAFLFTSTEARADAGTQPSPAGVWDVRWDRSLAGWSPPVFEGRLTLKRMGDVWSGELTFHESAAHISLESLTVKADHVEAVFDAPGGQLELWAILRGDTRFTGKVRWGKIDWTPVAGRRLPELIPAGVANTAFPRIDVKSANLDEAALQKLIDDASAEKSTALVVVKEGHTVVESYARGYDGGPLAAMSASKSVTSLAIGLLLAEHKLALETKLGDIFPEWREQSDKASITIRQLLTHTSGLDQARASVGRGRIAEHVAKARVVFPPGTRFQYNNDAVDLLSVIVKRRSGMALDQYLDEHLMKKLGITDATWMKDRDGNPFSAGELLIRPVDLAKIGQLLLDGGIWKGERILPGDWIEESVRPSQPFMENYGFLWWRDGETDAVLDEATLAFWRDAGVSDAIVARLRPLVGRSLTWGEYASAMQAVLDSGTRAKLDDLMRSSHLPNGGTRMKDPASGFSARGWLGQFLVIDPKARIVAVRMRMPRHDDYVGKGRDRDGFHAFPDKVHALVR
jgi:CubicO group peptidase (beta-lactamase class C family)